MPRPYHVAMAPPTPASSPSPTAEDLRRLPKVLLHEHLDGGLRPATLLALLHARGLPAPAGDADGLAAWFRQRAHAGSLVAYLEGFGLTVAAMASPAALARVAREAAEDARAEGCVLAEFRLAPLLFEPLGLAPEAVVESVLSGWQAAGLPGGILLCGMRQAPVEDSLRVAALVQRYRGQGVLGFDLAGPEAGHPAGDHAAALAWLRERGLPFTLHAGEADAGERVFEAVALGARRIGHGVRIAPLLDEPRWAEAVQALRTQGIHFELCLTSNAQTGALAGLPGHPVRRLDAAGLSWSYHTDNRLMSMTSLFQEAQLLVAGHGFGLDELRACARRALAASFVADAVREAVQSSLAARPDTPGGAT